jgi:DNA-binding NarL/FixJ family response regulator
MIRSPQAMSPIAEVLMFDTKKINVMVVHATPLIAAGLAASLDAECRVTLVSGFDHGRVLSAQAQAPAVVIADYPAGLGLMQQHRSMPWLPPPRCLIVAESTRCWQVRQALEHGVQGVIGADCSVQQLRRAVHSVHQGQRFLCEAASASMAESMVQESLTPREMDVLRLLGAGLDNKTISARLNIALGTVKTHVKAVLEKLDASSRTQAVAAALQRGLIHDGHDSASCSQRGAQRPAMLGAPLRVQ